MQEENAFAGLPSPLDAAQELFQLTCFAGHGFPNRCAALDKKLELPNAADNASTAWVRGRTGGVTPLAPQKSLDTDKYSDLGFGALKPETWDYFLNYTGTSGGSGTEDVELSLRNNLYFQEGTISCLL